MERNCKKRINKENGEEKEARCGVHHDFFKYTTRWSLVEIKITYKKFQHWSKEINSRRDSQNWKWGHIAHKNERHLEQAYRRYWDNSTWRRRGQGRDSWTKKRKLNLWKSHIDIINGN